MKPVTTTTTSEVTSVLSGDTSETLILPQSEDPLWLLRQQVLKRLDDRRTCIDRHITSLTKRLSTTSFDVGDGVEQINYCEERADTIGELNQYREKSAINASRRVLITSGKSPLCKECRGEIPLNKVLGNTETKTCYSCERRAHISDQEFALTII
ncbi:MAG: hypothetical protein M1150_00065 [Patescibacteria group bacterium]|nr:hypothetical protein [Patescibacteria group bacterium]